MRYLNEETQAELLDMEEVIDRVGQALNAFSEGKTKTPLRYVLPFNKHNRYLVMPALSNELKIVGLKTDSFVPDNPKNGKATISGSVILSDYETGETLAVLDGGYLTKIRTGAISGVATKYLSRKDAKVLCAIGAGMQAEGLIEAMMAVRDIEVVHFSSRTKEKADQLAKATQTKFGVEVYVYNQADEAMKEADIIVTATNAYQPVYSYTLHPGVHLN